MDNQDSFEDLESDNHLFLTDIRQIDDYLESQSVQQDKAVSEKSCKQYLTKACALSNEGAYGQALELLNEIVTHASPSSHVYMQALYVKAILLRQQGLIHQGFECLKEMLTLIDSDKYQYYIYCELGAVFITNGLLQPDKAIYYSNQAKSYANTRATDIPILNYAVNPSFVLGQAYMHLNQFERGDEAYNEAMRQAVQNDNLVLLERAKLAKLHASIKVKGVKEVPKSDLSILYDNNQNEICKRFAIEQLLKVEELYSELKAFTQAEKTLKEALALSKSSQLIDFQLIITKRLGELAKLQDNFQEGYNYLNEYIKLFHQKNPAFDPETSPKSNYDSYIKHIKHLEKTNSLIELSTNDLTQYAFIVAHDLKEPLRNIHSFSKLLKRNLGDTVAPEYVATINEIQEKTNALGNSLTALLMFASLDTKVDRDVVDLLDCFHTASKKCHQTITQSSAKFEVERLPKVWGNASMWTLFFEELIKNSIQFSVEDPIVKITCLDKKSIRYQDNSIGIPAELSEEVFRVFFKHKSISERPGMGLSLCKKVAQLQGASITLDTSSPNPGVCYDIKL